MWTLIGLLVLLAVIMWGLITGARRVGWKEVWGAVGYFFFVLGCLLGFIAAIVAGLLLFAMIFNNASPTEAWRILSEA